MIDLECLKPEGCSDGMGPNRAGGSTWANIP